ncbi:hypothetical protein [Pseudoclavibacter sp. JSM 162008]|uniref:hypothetical protein n=1 Tax=Pseudoclavibacter sp. JSM 162008 TaxID=3229855 RepID=UPI0035241842
MNDSAAPLVNTLGTHTWSVPLVGGKFAKSDAEKGPFGSSLYLDGKTAFILAVPQSDPIVITDYSEEITTITWHKSVSKDTNATCIFALHCESTSVPSRVWAQYVRERMYGGMMRFSANFGAQDGPTPGYPYLRDYASVGNQQVAQEWHMFTQVIKNGVTTAYVDGYASPFNDYTEPAPRPGYSLQQGPYPKNPYDAGKPINKSQTTKVLSIGAASGVNAGNFVGLNYEEGYLGGAAIFDRAFTPEEVMAVRLATLQRGATKDPVLTVDFAIQNSRSGEWPDPGTSGPRALRDRGYFSYGGVTCKDLSRLTTGEGYWHHNLVSLDFDFLTREGSSIAPAIAGIEGISGLPLARMNRVTGKLLSDTPSATPIQIAMRVSGVWYVSVEKFGTSRNHAVTDVPDADSFEYAIIPQASRWRRLYVQPTEDRASTIRNESTNPRLLSDSRGYGSTNEGPGFTLGRYQTGGLDNGPTRRLIVSSAPASRGGGAEVSSFEGVQAGQMYNASAHVRASKSRPLVARLVFFSATGARVAATNQDAVQVVARTLTRLSVWAPAPTNAVRASLQVVAPVSGSPWTTGDWIEVSGVQRTKGQALLPYFDGASPGASWGGLPNASASTKPESSVAGSLAIGGVLSSNIANGSVQALAVFSPANQGTQRVSKLRYYSD